MKKCESCKEKDWIEKIMEPGKESGDFIDKIIEPDKYEKKDFIDKIMEPDEDLGFAPETAYLPEDLRRRSKDKLDAERNLAKDKNWTPENGEVDERDEDSGLSPMEESLIEGAGKVGGAIVRVAGKVAKKAKQEIDEFEEESGIKEWQAKQRQAAEDKAKEIAGKYNLKQKAAMEIRKRLLPKEEAKDEEAYVVG